LFQYYCLNPDDIREMSL